MEAISFCSILKSINYIIHFSSDCLINEFVSANQSQLRYLIVVCVSQSSSKIRLHFQNESRFSALEANKMHRNEYF